MVMKRRCFLIAIVFSISCMFFIQTNFTNLFVHHDWTSKLYTLSNLDSWTASNSRRTVLSSSQHKEADSSGQTSESITDRGQVETPKLFSIKYPGKASEEGNKENQFTIDISPLNWFKSNDIIKDSYEKYFRSHLINYPYFTPNDNGGKKFSDMVSVFDKYNPLKAIPIVEPNQVSRVLLVTYFRSGSSFLGDILQQNFRTFYTFEPLHYLESGKGNRIGDDKFEQAATLISNILKCNFPLITPYIKWALRPENRFLFKWNTFLWSTCRFKPSACFNPSLLKETCIRSPIQVIKFTRIHMRQIARYFASLGGTNIPSINQGDIAVLDWIRANSTKVNGGSVVPASAMGSAVTNGPQIPGSIDERVVGSGRDVLRNSIKVVFLVRDPRGIYNSRKNMTWCSNSPCSNIHSLCKEMSEDLKEYERLKLAQPDTFHLIRFEDLSLDPIGTTSELFKRLNVPFSNTVQRYIKSHTHLKPKKKVGQPTTRRSGGFFWSSFKIGHKPVSSDGDPYSTRRNSKNVAFEWRNKLSKEELTAIESKCANVIDKLGYRELVT